MSTDNKNYTKYKVKKGDSLYKIAKEKGIPFSDILKANASLKNSSLIMPDEEINLPGNYNTIEDETSNEERDRSVNYLYKKDKSSDSSYYPKPDGYENSPYIIAKGNNAKRLSEAELAKFNQLAGTNIQSRAIGDEYGGTYAYYDDNGIIQTIGSAPINPSTSIPAEASVWKKDRLYGMSTLADMYGYNLEDLKPEDRKHIEDLSKQLGYSPKEAYFELNKYIANSGQSIPRKWREDLGISDSRIDNLKSLSENKNSSAYLYNFNPTYHESSDIIDHDLPINLVRGLRAGAGIFTRGLSEMPLQWGSAALDLLGSYAKNKKAATVTKGLANAIYETDPAANWIVDPIARATNSSNAGTAVAAGTSAALTGKGLLGKIISGVGTGISTAAGEALKDNGYTKTGTAIEDLGSTISSMIGSKGTSFLTGAGSAYGARKALDIGARAALNTGELELARTAAGLVADAANMSDQQKASLEGLTTGVTGMMTNKVPGLKRVQNYIDTVSPFSNSVNTAFTRSGGRPDLQSATSNVINDNPLPPFELFNTNNSNSKTITNAFKSLVNIGVNKLYQNIPILSRAQNSQSLNYIPNTYNGITVNSNTPRLTAPGSYEGYQRQKERQFLDPNNPDKKISLYGVSDYSVPENFRYTDYNGNEVRVPTSRDVRHQARKIRRADADENLSFDTSAPLWSLVSGKVPLKKGQSVQYSNAKVSSTTLQEGDIFYNPDSRGNNNVVLVEPTGVLDSSLSTKIMNDSMPSMTTNSREMSRRLANQGYTKYDEITMGNQNVDRQKSIGQVNGEQVDMNLKGCTTKVSVYSKPNSSNRNEDVIVITDNDLASPGSAREHYTQGNNQRDADRVLSNKFGIESKQKYKEKYVTKDRYTEEEATQLLQEVYKDLESKQKGILKSAKPVEVKGNGQGEVSKSKMKEYLDVYLNTVRDEVSAVTFKGTSSRVEANKSARNIATQVSHRVVTDLGSTSFTREEVAAKLGNPENPEKGTLRWQLNKLEKESKAFDILKMSKETQKKLSEEGYKIFDDNGNPMDGKISLSKKHAKEVGISAEYNQAYDSDYKKLKALISFGEGEDIRQALK